MSKKGTLSITNFIYGMGAAIVIVGALFKIQHWPYASLILTIGMLVEAGVFAFSAFDRAQNDLDWSLVYPELGGGAAVNKAAVKEEMLATESALSKKLDTMLKDAKIDAELMESLGKSIRGFEGAARGIAPTAEAMTSTQRYSEEMALAAAQMESLNGLYKVQVETAGRQAAINNEVVNNAGVLKDQMQSLATNLSSLNGVYGGMLSAMSPKR
jgi:gliding motility-associated protein GldL